VIARGAISKAAGRAVEVGADLAISGNWWQLVELVAISGHSWPFVVEIGADMDVTVHATSEVIRGHQRSSDVIRGHQRSSEVIATWVYPSMRAAQRATAVSYFIASLT